jgi:hypothetical protein
MRASLVAPLRASRQRRRDHLRSRRSAPAVRTTELVQPQPAPRPEPRAAVAVADGAATIAGAAPRTDPDVERARRAGGPIDRACYSCECGYRFDAPVSTTVSCPHCGCDQAW